MSAAACKPNITARGRQRRMVVGVLMTLVTIAFAVCTYVARTPALLRASVFFPAIVAAVGFLQARRGTCVAHARVGTVENDDFSASPAAPDENAASRAVAATILRDAAVAAAVVTAAALASAWL